MTSSRDNIGLWMGSSGWRFALACYGVAELSLLGSASANIVYSGEQNIVIPQDFNGVFINVSDFLSGNTVSFSWDLNPFFGGLGIANAPNFQPVRIGTGHEDSILALGLGSSIGGSSTFSSGWGGSGAEDNSGHVGPGASQFSPDQISYMGFKLIRDDTVNYGWMRVNLTRNGDTGSILDWAFDSSGNSILAGAVANLGPSPRIMKTGSEQTLRASEVGSGLLMEGDAKITFYEGLAGGIYSGNIQGHGEIRIDGSGGLRLSGANSFSGTALLLEGSRLIVSEAENLGRAQIRIGNSASVIFDSLAANDSSANIFANDIVLDGRSATLNNSGNVKISLSGTLDSNGGLLGFSGGSIDILGSISGSGALHMEGAGTLKLANNNTYTGSTTISKGTLAIGSNGSIDSSSEIILAADSVLNVSDHDSGYTFSKSQSLSGGGMIVGDTIISGMHLPGFSPGIQTFEDNLTYTADSNIFWELINNTKEGRGTIYDGIDVGGNLTFPGITTITLELANTESVVDWIDSYWNADRLKTNGWKIFDVAGLIVGFENLTLAGDFLDGNGVALNESRENASFFLFQAEDGIYLNYEAIPETSSSLLGLFGSMLILRRKRIAAT